MDIFLNPKILCSCEGAFFITRESVYGCGSNKKGFLGLGSRCMESLPTEILIPNKRIKKIACSSASCHSVILTHDRELYAMGQNVFKELGVNSEEYSVFNVKKMNYFHRKDVEVLDVFVGKNRTYVKICVQLSRTVENGSERKKMYFINAFGANPHGVLGIGFSSTFEATPKGMKLSSEVAEKVSHIATGDIHSQILSDGAIYGVGSNHHNLLGTIGARDAIKPRKQMLLNVNYVTQVCCGKSFSLFLTKNGDCYMCGKFITYHDRSLRKIKIEGSDINTDTKIELIRNTMECCFFRTVGGRILSYFSADSSIANIKGLKGKYGVIPVEITFKEFIPIDFCGSWSTFYFLDDKGDVWSAGRNDNLVLGYRTKKKMQLRFRRITRIPPLFLGSASITIPIGKNYVDIKIICLNY